ncbi:MAG: glycosyltransferase family 4 protein [Patescibacteria group bacterium]|nr:glycosyltransferase family 4 protein [Patescibacteria group bacterium]
MNILMISTDKVLVGVDQLGDVIERHRAYGEQPGVERLDIVVFSLKGSKGAELSSHVFTHPTNSVSKLLYLTDAIKMADHLYTERNYDVVVTQDPFLTGLVGAHMKRKHGSKLLAHFHGDFFDNPLWKKESKLNAIFLKFANSIVTQADGLRVVSQGIADKIVKHGIPAERIRVIPTPVEVTKFQQAKPELVAQFRRDYKIPDAKIIINAGRNDPAKDFGTLMATMSKVCQSYAGKVHLLQIGAGLDAGKILQDVQAPAGNFSVTATGRLSYDAMVLAYHAADVYVSSSKHESLGKVLIEANAAGLPVVATATTGSKEIIEPGFNGYLVPVGDAAALAEKTVHLLQNPELTRVMGERGRALVAERFDGRKNTQLVVQFWRDLTKQS